MTVPKVLSILTLEGAMLECEALDEADEGAALVGAPVADMVVIEDELEVEVTAAMEGSLPPHWIISHCCWAVAFIVLEVMQVETYCWHSYQGTVLLY